ncbi:MAG: valine--tRNA ligase [Chitinophagaceae bacterium]|nr:valine--tRNA ligase [Chitinophagaceae bacterium]
MSIPIKYEHTEREKKWSDYWETNAFFKAKEQSHKKPFSIVIPPPNVTGILHMGHILNNTIQDILIRRARMQGFESCWVAGTDHASIATEAKVVQMLREKGIKKSDLSREEFLQYAWEWKEKYGGIILEQLKKLGTSCDWDRTTFTMDEHYHKAVIRVFVDLYKKGYIYRGKRIINWDCEARTALSNEEVIYKEEGEISTLFFIKYYIENETDPLIIATQRPETIFGDVAIAVNPTDERYTRFIGKNAIVPFIKRKIPIIADNYVEKEFGTGCLKVTPAHDPNDYEIGIRHHLPVIDTLNDNGTLNELCEMPNYIGKDRFLVKKLVVEDLTNAGLLVKTEAFTTRIGRSERTNSVVEPKLSTQWFMKMKQISQKAHQAVVQDEIKLYPSKFKNTYSYWMENVRDWCISRQLWWGQRIPAYYLNTDNKNEFIVAETKEEALKIAQENTKNNSLTLQDIHQDEDVLDTWASSWLWPLEVFHGFDDKCFDTDTGKIMKEKNPAIQYFYPTDTLVTAPEILFFWVARMIIAGYEYTGEKPFRNVYLTGIVRDKQGRKMSKSLGNSPDPLELIEKYGADSLRSGMLFCSPAGNDLLFDISLIEQGWNFSHKIWNAFRLIKNWKTEDTPSPHLLAIEWFQNTLAKSIHEIEEYYQKFRISDALKCLYKLLWDDFCSWYLEIIKPPYSQPIDSQTLKITEEFLETILKMLHPFIPFITEDIWQQIKERKQGESITIQAYPSLQEYNPSVIQTMEHIFETITKCREVRNVKGIPQKTNTKLIIKLPEAQESPYKIYQNTINKLANVSISFDPHYEAKGDASFHIKGTEFFIPLDMPTDYKQEKMRIEKEIEYARGFLESVNKKLQNEKFISTAPEKVISLEKKKQEDAQFKITLLEKQLQELMKL